MSDGQAAEVVASSTSQFDGFDTVAATLEAAAESALRGDFCGIRTQQELFADFRRVTPHAARKTAGTFFTGTELSSRLFTSVPQTGVVLDPACGIGDLLLSHALRLRPEKSLEGTLDSWGERLLGRELEAPLVRVARARLALAAAGQHRGGPRKFAKSRQQLDAVLPGLQQGDGLRTGPDVARVQQILLNPPYTPTQAPPGCTWAAGRVSAAAVFVDHWLSAARPGSIISAILPDVLRSGSRYTQWRARVEARAIVDAVDVVGQFDPQTQIDVFVVRMKVREAELCDASGRPWVSHTSGATLGTLFRVSVGPLVDYREPNLGPWHPYIDVSRAVPWGEVNDPRPFRRFRGRGIQPPFLVVRRTSSPHDRQRAIATLVTGTRPVAVENHLIVLEPFEEPLRTCRFGREILGQARTTEYLNSRIRCRHLTVDSVREIPLG
jgi:hypothetical protein